MSRIDVTITTADGECPATFCTPDGEGPWPAVVMFVDAGGRRPAMEDMAAHLAGMGYATLLPDVYYRHGDWQPFDMDTVFSAPGERERLMSMVHSLTAEGIASDTAAFADFLADRPEVSGGAIGTTGYCMGGRASLVAAGRLPDRIAAAASFHGGGLATEDPISPIHTAEQITATVYVAGAENDASFPPEQAERLDKALTAAGVEYTIETYPAAHGFAVPDNPTYDKAAADRHWTALERLYGATLD